MDEEKKTTEKLNEKVEEQLKKVAEQGITSSNIDYTYKLIDIHKDIANEKYWEKKGEMMEMRYSGYGEGYGEGYSEGGYGRRGVPGSGRGRYRGEYGRRGVPGTGRGRYRGEDAMMEMQENYEEYNEASEYGAEDGMEKATEGIMNNVSEIIKELSESGAPEVMRVVKKHLQKMCEKYV